MEREPGAIRGTAGPRRRGGDGATTDKADDEHAARPPDLENPPRPTTPLHHRARLWANSATARVSRLRFGDLTARQLRAELDAKLGLKKQTRVFPKIDSVSNLLWRRRPAHDDENFAPSGSSVRAERGYAVAMEIAVAPPKSFKIEYSRQSITDGSPPHLSIVK